MTSLTNAMLFSSDDGPYLQKCWATSPSKTTPSFKNSLRGLQWNLHQNPHETAQDLGFKNIF